jgi:hypothetical protein
MVVGSFSHSVGFGGVDEFCLIRYKEEFKGEE